MSAWYTPVSGSYRVSSNFEGGFRTSGGHSGIDFAAPHGSIVRAVVPGVVISSGWGGAYGNLVKVRHADGTIGYYAHNSRNVVKPGMKVSRGTPLGYVGSTGNSTGPHSHFEVRRNGTPVDPTPWLSQNYRATSATSNQSLSPGVYDGVRLDAEQLRMAQIIISTGKSMGASDRDVVIGLMTAMQESRLRNLNYGHSDSLGLFQQRPSQGWGSVSQVTNPQYAARKFFDALLRVGNRDRMRLTEAAQAVQRSAFPNAYAQWEGLARSIFGNPGAGSYFVDDYNQFHTREMYRDPAAVFASLGMPSMGVTVAPESPTDTPGAGPTESAGEAVTASFDEEEFQGFEWGPFEIPPVDQVPLGEEPPAPVTIEPVERRPASGSGRTPTRVPAGRGRLEY